MIPLRRRLSLYALQCLDLGIVSTSLVAAAALASGRRDLDLLSRFTALADTNLSVALALLVGGYLVLWRIVLEACGLYRSHRIAARSRERGEILAAVAFASLPLLPASAFLPALYAHPGFLLVFPSCCLIGLVAARGTVRRIARGLRRQGRNLRSVVIVVDDEAALDAAMKLAGRVELGYQVTEVLEVRDRHEPVASLVERLERLMGRQPVDEVFLALSLDVPRDLRHALIGAVDQQGITLRLIANPVGLSWGSLSVETLGDEPVITIASGPRDSLHLALKRAIDVSVALTCLTLFAPLLALLALAVRLDSKGPVLFAQQRVGQKRRVFRAYKFRTMIDGAEELQRTLEHLNEADGPVFKIKDDPRTTRVGRWLRRLSLDELPQLYNVLIGNMSLVGPRPLPVRDVERMDVSWHKRRFVVKPGITCIWQASRREPLFHEWVTTDMAYIDNWSLALDFRILAKTFWIVVSRQGTH